MRVAGSCHCRNLAFTLDWQPDPTEIVGRACTCTFCSKHGGVWTSCPTGSLEITVGDPSLVSRYSFATKTAEFLVCTRCGVVPLVVSRIDDRDYGVVNVNCFENVDAARLRRVDVTHDDADTDARLARRKRNWTPARVDGRVLADGMERS